MLGLRRISVLGDGHCCVYSIAQQLDFKVENQSALAFNISSADCLGLRQKAYDLLTTPSAFLSGCVAPYAGNPPSCCGNSGCRDWRRRTACASKVKRGPDGNPVEWTSEVLEPLLKMSPVGYVGDHFIRAMAVLFRRDIVVLYESGRGCKPGAKIFYANPTWFVTKSSSCLNKPGTIFNGIYDSVTDWDAFVAWFETGICRFRGMSTRASARLARTPATPSSSPITVLLVAPRTTIQRHRCSQPHLRLPHPHKEANLGSCTRRQTWDPSNGAFCRSNAL